MLPHLELLDPPLQTLGVEVGLLGGQLVLGRLEPPGEGAGEPPELEELLLAGLNGCKPERRQTTGQEEFNEQGKTSGTSN